MHSLTEKLRALYEERKLEEARALYEGDRAQPDPEWHWIGALVYYHLGNLWRSRESSEAGLRSLSQGELHAKLLHLMGAVCERLGDHTVAIQTLETCLEELDGYPQLAPLLRGIVTYNLAVAYGGRSSRPDDQRSALALYESAALEFGREGMEDSRRMALQNLAWIACDLRDGERAAQVIDEAAPLCTSSDARWAQRVLHGYLHLVNGEYGEAMGTLEPAMAAPGAPTDVQILAVSVAALTALALATKRTDVEMLELAKRLADHAYSRAAVPSGDDRCFTVAKRALNRVTAALREVKSQGA